MRHALEMLSPMERTAWNDACCRAVMQRRGTVGVDDGFAAWLFDCLGMPPEFMALDPSVPIGIAARRRAFDRLAEEVVQPLREAERPFEVWFLGVGLDARAWLSGEAGGSSYASAAAEVREFDLPGLLEARTRLIDLAPFAKTATPPLVAAADLSRETRFPRTGRPVVVIAEGLFDHLAEAARRDLLLALARAAPSVSLLMDSLSPAAQAYDNRRCHRFTGDPSLRFVGAASDPAAFHAKLGWTPRRSVGLFGEMASVLSERHQALRPLSRVPLPGFVRRLYALHWLEHVGC